MRLAITGAAGGIGRSLVNVLRQSHQVTGIVRATPPATDDGVEYATYADAQGLAAALGGADCVLHNALDSRAKPRDFLAINEKLNRDILDGALAGRCRLYVYVSSQVVYAGMDPAPSGYREDQPLVLTDKLDDYTRLKIEEERRIIDACTKRGVGYLIVRPTVVMGPGMAWSEGVVKASRFITVGIRERTMNLIHVEDLARFVERLLERGVTNEVFNLGTENFSSEEYFGQVGMLTGHRPLFVPRWLMNLVGTMLPSTLWFFGRDVSIDGSKVAAVTGLQPQRTIAEYFARKPITVVGDTMEALRAAQLSSHPFRAYGQGYSHWFNPAHGDDRLAMGGYSGIVSLKDGLITVKSGTRLIDIAEYLDERGLALPTLPEFSGISAGAAFFTDVHGSSNTAFSLYDFITGIKYLDDAGNEIVSQRNEAEWAELRARQSRFILTELTFRTEPAGYLSNSIEWRDDSELIPYLESRHRENEVTTLHWYPHYKKLLVYSINHAKGPQAGAAPSVAPFRGLPYRLQQVMLRLKLRGRAIQVDRQHRILAPWRKVPFEPIVKWMMTRPNHAWRDLEFCVSIGDAIALVTELRAMAARGEIAFRRRMGIGMRFAYRQPQNEGHVWIEFVSDNPPFVEKFIATARRVAKDGVAFHRGKYLPR